MSILSQPSNRKNDTFASVPYSRPSSDMNFKFCKSRAVRLSGSCNFSILLPFGNSILFTFVPPNNASLNRGNRDRSIIPVSVPTFCASILIIAGQSPKDNPVIVPLSGIKVESSSPTFNVCNLLEATDNVGFLADTCKSLKSPKSLI